MAKPEWGAKHLCQGCGAKFYDMGRTPVTCPSCDEPVVVATPGRTRRVRKEEVKAEPVAANDEAKKPKDGDEALASEVDDLVDDDDDEDDAVATLADDDDDDEDDDDVLAEADISKDKISNE